MWAVLTEFAAYPEWNPFIRRITGELREDVRLEVRIEPPGARASTFKPTVRAVERNRELRWLGRLLVPGIFDGEHTLLIEPREGGRSRFVQSERFSGFLVGFVKSTLTKTEGGLEQMNAALQGRRRAALHAELTQRPGAPRSELSERTRKPNGPARRHDRTLTKLR